MKSGNAADKLIEINLYFDLIQQVTLPTRIQGTTKTLIDHVYTNTKQASKTDVIMCDISDHYATLTVFLSTKIVRSKISITKRWYTAETYEQMNILLRHESWTPMRVMNCDEATNYLIDKITESLDIVAPIETKTFNEKHDNDWMTPGISISLAHKARLYKKHKAAANNPTLKNIYKNLQKPSGQGD